MKVIVPASGLTSVHSCRRLIAAICKNSSSRRRKSREPQMEATAEAEADQINAITQLAGGRICMNI